MKMRRVEFISHVYLYILDPRVTPPLYFDPIVKRPVGVVTRYCNIPIHNT
jgi:hypothetical protein